MILSDQELERLAKVYLGKDDEFRTRVEFGDYLESQPYACEVDERGRELPRTRLERFMPVFTGPEALTVDAQARAALTVAVASARVFTLREAA